MKILTRMMEGVRVRTRDELLKPSLEKNYETDLGRVWPGDLRPVGEAVAQVLDALRGIKNRARLADAMAQVIGSIGEFGAGLDDDYGQSQPAGTLASVGDRYRRHHVSARDFGKTISPAKLQVINRAHYDPASAFIEAGTGVDRQRTGDRRGPGITPAALNSIHARFWDAINRERAAAELGGGWGKG